MPSKDNWRLTFSDGQDSCMGIIVTAEKHWIVENKIDVGSIVHLQKWTINQVTNINLE